MKVSRFLTSRSTVIALFSAIAAALLLASAVPQRASLGGKTPEWVGRLPEGLSFLSALLGLDNIVGSAWFALLIAIFWLSLVISTVAQYRSTKALCRRVPAAALPPESVRIEIAPDSFSGLLTAAGYRFAGGADGVQRYVKNGIGYWGNFMLHVGLVTAVVFSLGYVVTQHRVLIRLVAQEITSFSAEDVQELRGILPLQQGLPYSVVLKSLDPRFWANDKLEYLASELYFTGKPGADPQRVAVALSDKSQFGPYLVYQSSAYGRAFDLEFESPPGEMHRERLYLPYPNKRDGAGYGELPLGGTGFLLKGKFYADSARRSMQLHQPPLTLRLYQGKQLQQEVTLAPGIAQRLGPFKVRLVHSEWWTDILLDGSRGTAGIFTGFALILAGVLSSYCLVPREIIVREADGAHYAQQVVRRFPQFYREEFDEIMLTARQPAAHPG